MGDVLAAWPGARKIAVLISPGRQSPRISQYLSQDEERARMFATLQQANVNVYIPQIGSADTRSDVVYRRSQENIARVARTELEVIAEERER